MSEQNGGASPDDLDAPRPRAKKTATAFRTISEVADELHIPQHVLRFWETKFPQIKPLKRGGGRRYYRPDDIQLLRRISDLLYIQGYTIKGVQRLLREGGGQLADDIPPAPPAERAAAEAERAAPPSLPGLEPAAPAPANDQAAALRAVMETILHELTELRALLDVGDTAKTRGGGA
ncbi:MAG: MerR family transcriptional regulator [Acetobacteraceae bacterium]|nr:MerR family transcriptional regulator [Acetobacteraceae bacterium]